MYDKYDSNKINLETLGVCLGDLNNHEGEVYGGENFRLGAEEDEKEKGEGPIGLSKLGSSSTAELHPKALGGGGGLEPVMGKQMPPASVMTRLILIMVWRKLIRNPNTYSSLIGLIWSLVAFRYAIQFKNWF